jgi:cytosine/adenosine deaminase-related metal-dependent hydrolase
MIEGDLAVHGGRVHPVVAGGDALAPGCVLIRAGRVADLTPAEGCGCAGSGSAVLDATGMTVLPGFVDGHRHTWQTAFRQTLAGASISSYGRTMLAGLARYFEPEDVYVGTLLGALTALDSGTTTIVDWSHVMNSPEHADAAVAALRASGIRAQFAHGIPRDGTPAWSVESTLPHPRDLERIAALLAADDRISAVMAARGPEMSAPEVARDDLLFARALGIRISMHVGAGDLGSRVRAVSRLAEAGLLADDITFVHLNSTSDAELDLISAAGAGVCIGPATEQLMPELGWPVTGRLLRHGLRPALSVDTETASSGSMFDQVRAVLSGLAAEPGSAAMSPAEVLDLATGSGAAAIGLGGKVGQIAPGAVGDLVLIDGTAVNLAPAENDLDAIALAGHAGNVRAVVVGGVVRKGGGVLLGHDIPALADEARASVARIRARAAA